MIISKFLSLPERQLVKKHEMNLMLSILKYILQPQHFLENTREMPLRNTCP